MANGKIKCYLCGNEIYESNYPNHLARHQENPETFLETKNVEIHNDLSCEFCGKECKNKNSLAQHEVRCKNNPDKIDMPSFRGRTPWNKGKTAKDDNRIADGAKKRSIYYESHDGSFKGKKHSEESKLKISSSMKEFCKNNPERVPYVLNHSSKMSYPEKYFYNIFNNLNLNLLYNYPIFGYRLDFADIEQKLYIEIDGEQHYTDKRIIKHDVERTAILSKNGWNCFRIRWSDYKKKTHEDKVQCIYEILNFLGH